MDEKKPGKIFLFWCGILLILYGGVSSLMYGMILARYGTDDQSVTLVLVLLVITGLIYFAGGVAGIFFGGNLKKTVFCRRMGILMIAFGVVSQLLIIKTSPSISATTSLQSLGVILLPFIYYYGAYLNAKSLS